MPNDSSIPRDTDSLQHPNLDFKSLQAAVDRVRCDDGHRNAAVKEELDAIRDAPRTAPFRSRYPIFRWRLIPTVYCAFYGALCIGGLVTFDAATGNA